MYHESALYTERYSVAYNRIARCRFIHSQRISEGLVLAITDIPLDVFLLTLLPKHPGFLLVLQSLLMHL